jgi:hypothetical protein
VEAPLLEGLVCLGVGGRVVGQRPPASGGAPERLGRQCHGGVEECLAPLLVAALPVPDGRRDEVDMGR